MERIVVKASILFLLCISVILPSFAIADEVNYLYDDTGRVVRVLKGTERLLYQYDEVGNLLSILEETSTPQALPPVLQGIDPDIFLIGSNYYATLTGQNLLTTSSITSDNPNITIKNIAAIDTKITATLSIGSGAVPGQANITVTTSYGSASITINLYDAIIIPEAISLFPPSTAIMSASLNPSATKDLKVSIYNKNPDIINTQSSVLIPAGGSADFTVKALQEGTGTIRIGTAETIVYVLEVSSISINASPLCVSIGSVSGDMSIYSSPVSVGFGVTGSLSAFSKAVSVEWPTVPGATIVSMPVCVRTSDISISPVYNNFGNVNVGSTSVPETFTIFNSGTVNLLIGTITLTGTNASEFGIQNDNCSGQTITPSSTCTVQAVFSPASAGAKSAALSIPSNNPHTPILNVPLSGKGLPQYTLTVTKAGTGSGTVTSSPSGIICGADCSEPYNSGTTVTLTATAEACSTFTGWSGGGCSGTGTCTVTVDVDKSVNATFTKQYTLTVTKAGTGSGTVTSSPSGISCGADCSEKYNYGTSLELTAASDAGSTFINWSGDCSGSVSPITIVIDGDKTCTATFNDITPPTVSSTNPTNDATGVPVTSPISAIFSEAMDALTITTDTFTLSGGVIGTVTYNVGTKTATLTPSSNLAYGTTYIVSITTGVKDTHGNNMSSNYTWSFTTSPISTTGLKLWLKADAGITKDAGDFVSAWADQSGNGLDVTQGTPASQPVFVPNALNGIPVVRFDGTDDSLFRPSVTGSSLFRDSAATVVILLRQSSADMQNTPFAWVENPGNHFLIHAADSNLLAFQFGNPSSGGSIAANAPSGWADTFHVLVMRRDGNSGEIRRDGVSLPLVQVFSSPSDSLQTGDMWVGSDFWSNTFTGDIAEIIVYNEALSDADRTIVENYLSTRYAIAFDVTAPTVTGTNPTNGDTNVPVSSAITATFSEAMDASTINTSTFTVSGGVTGTVSYNAGTKTATFTPSSNLVYNTTYAATITTGVKDSAGNAIAVNYPWSFTTIQQYTLTVTKAGTGSGTVTSLPSGISCGSDCSEPYSSGTGITLTATADAGSVFTGWSGGGCSGTGTCVVTISADTVVTASFGNAISITVTVPNGGESWEAGGTYTIRWTYTGNPGSNVKIELYKGGSLNRTIKSSTSKGSGGSGSYNWAIPVTQAGGTDYKIKITSTSNSSYTDTSDNDFTIVAATITVTVPNGGENWRRGTTQIIRWTYTGNPGSNVKIELLKGGSLNSTVTSSTSIGSGGSGSYNWTIPSNQTAGTNYKIRITSTSTIKDSSDNNFTISQ